MWMLAGYGDHLEEGMPGLKASAAEAGGADGFVDVVAQLQPIADGDDTPPHWDVTFATDDVEATPTLASKLGAEVLHGAVYAPGVRPAAIRTPQRATLVWKHLRWGQSSAVRGARSACSFITKKTKTTQKI